MPVGASGSQIVIAKLFVSGGNPFHASCGEVFSPVHPKLLNTVFVGSVPPAGKVVLVTAIGFALVGFCGAAGVCAAAAVAQSVSNHAPYFMRDKVVTTGPRVMWVSGIFLILSRFA